MTKSTLLNVISLMGLPEPSVYSHEDEVIFEWCDDVELGKPLGTIVRLILDDGELQLMVSFDNSPPIFADINFNDGVKVIADKEAVENLANEIEKGKIWRKSISDAFNACFKS